MQYLALIYNDENQPVDPAVRAEVFARYMAFNKEAGAAGVLLGGNALMPSSTATTVSVRNGETLLTDGPFAETREALGGYYLLQCDNLDTAVEWAAKIPTSETGRIEVRPVMEIEGAGAPG